MDEKKRVTRKFGYWGNLDKFDLDHAKRVFKSQPKPTRSWADDVEGEERAKSRRRHGSKNAQAKLSRTNELPKPTHKAENKIN